MRLLVIAICLCLVACDRPKATVAGIPADLEGAWYNAGGGWFHANTTTKKNGNLDKACKKACRKVWDIKYKKPMTELNPNFKLKAGASAVGQMVGTEIKWTCQCGVAD